MLWGRPALLTISRVSKQGTGLWAEQQLVQEQHKTLGSQALSLHRKIQDTVPTNLSRFVFVLRTRHPANARSRYPGHQVTPVSLPLFCHRPSITIQTFPQTPHPSKYTLFLNLEYHDGTL